MRVVISVFFCLCSVLRHLGGTHGCLRLLRDFEHDGHLCISMEMYGENLQSFMKRKGKVNCSICWVLMVNCSICWVLMVEIVQERATHTLGGRTTCPNNLGISTWNARLRRK